MREACDLLLRDAGCGALVKVIEPEGQDLPRVICQERRHGRQGIAQKYMRRVPTMLVEHVGQNHDLGVGIVEVADLHVEPPDAGGELLEDALVVVHVPPG